MYWFICYLSFENFIFIFNEISLYPPPSSPPLILPYLILPTHSSLNFMFSFSVHFYNMWIPISSQSWAWWMLFFSLPDCLPSRLSCCVLFSGGSAPKYTFLAFCWRSCKQQGAGSIRLASTLGIQLHTGSLTQLHTKHKTLRWKLSQGVCWLNWLNACQALRTVSNNQEKLLKVFIMNVFSVCVLMEVCGGQRWPWMSIFTFPCALVVCYGVHQYSCLLNVQGFSCSCLPFH